MSDVPPPVADESARDGHPVAAGPPAADFAAQPVRGERWVWRLLLAAALLIGLGLRLPAVFAGYPYLAYVDEGHLLQPARRLLATGVWRPSENHYPKLPVGAIAGAARLAASLLPAATAERLRAEVRQAGTLPTYSIVQPPELLLLARWLSLLLSLGIVWLAGLYARRLVGDLAGGVAALAASLLPALVLRGAIVTVDVYATFLVLAALVLVAGVQRPRQWARVAAAGACCGLAAVSKYPAGLVGLAVSLELLLASWPPLARLRAVVLAAACGAVAAVLAMPSLVLAPREVWERLVWQGEMYRTLQRGSYWDQAVRHAEWDLAAHPPELGWPFLLLAAAGLAVGLARPRWRVAALGWLIFGGLLVGLHARYDFQAFRNFLPLAALACVAFALLCAWAGERWRRPRTVAVLAAGLLAALFVRADVAYARERAVFVDSRHEAVSWLARHGSRRAPTLVLDEAVVAPRELARLGKPLAADWAEARPHLLAARPRFVLVPGLDDGGGKWIGAADRAAILALYRVRATFGSETGTVGEMFRGNRLRVYVLERRPGARRSLKAAIRSATGANSSSGKFSALSQNSPSPPAPHDS